MKKWYLSKTFWVNIIAIIAIIAQQQFGHPINADVQIYLLSAINLVLRTLTKEKLEWTGKDG